MGSCTCDCGSLWYGQPFVQCNRKNIEKPQISYLTIYHHNILKSYSVFLLFLNSSKSVYLLTFHKWQVPEELSQYMTLTAELDIKHQHSLLVCYTFSALGAAALDSKLYVCGGYDGVSSLSSVERYDPAANQWSLACHMTRHRSAAGVTVFDGQIYALGGHDGLSIFDSVSSSIVFVMLWPFFSSCGLFLFLTPPENKELD